MRQAHVYRNGALAGVLSEVDRNHYVFEYDEKYRRDDQQPAVSLTLPKKMARYQADHLFPFFFNMLSEGANRQLQHRHLAIDERDDFGLLLATAHTETIGPVTVTAVS